MAVLEASMTSRTRENGKKALKTDKKQVKKVLLVAQELKLARVLAGNNKTARDRALKSLKKWFQNRSTTIPFTEDDFLRLWKGLFYSMWMSDKPLVQEECAENISNLVHVLPVDTALLFYKCGMTILMNEWFGIDQLRLDKFLMFARRMLRQILFVLKNQNWSLQTVKKFTENLSETILNTQKQKPMGLLMHFSEIYLEELSKVSQGELPPHLMTHFLGPFIKELACSDDTRIIDHIRKHVFIYLIRQSDLGLEYQAKYEAWRDLGFPGSIDSMKKIEDTNEESGGDASDEETGEKELVYDPRAGRVDVELPQLKFHPKTISKALSECKFQKNTNTKSRKCLTELSEHFKKMASGVYPLGIKKVKLASDDYDTSLRKAVNRLVKFDQKIKGKKNKRKLKDEHDIELRSGKKIKLDDQLCKKVTHELDDVSPHLEKTKKKRKLPEPLGETSHVIIHKEPEKKRKQSEATDAPPAKQKKSDHKAIDDLLLESVFRRNSGTWFVTRRLRKVKVPENKWGVNGDATIEKSPEKKLLFPSDNWETSSDQIAETVERSFKKLVNKISSANSTPVKKVKINTSLNRSQDVQEHVAQIKSSPAIPYDANKKPTKPLLKTPTLKSPLNPFYKL